MEYQKSCGAVVYRLGLRGPEFLLLQSKPGKYFGFPKGHVEEGETERETAAREILEETSLEVEFIGDFRDTTVYRIGDLIEKTVILFLARAKTNSVRLMLEEIENYVWADYEAAMRILIFENLRAILSRAKEYIDNYKQDEK